MLTKTTLGLKWLERSPDEIFSPWLAIPKVRGHSTVTKFTMILNALQNYTVYRPLTTYFLINNRLIWSQDLAWLVLNNSWWLSVWYLPSNQSFYRQFASYGKEVGRHKVGQNYQQNSYLTVIGVHSTMYLMHPNYCQITIINFVGYTILFLCNFVLMQ